jgi:Vitamin B6 photo-protection and homoeostasis
MANAVGTTMTAHFARRGNLADLSAKGASLGTVAQLVGTAVGTAVIHSTEGVWETWCTLIILIVLHLALNYKSRPDPTSIFFVVFVMLAVGGRGR